MYWNMVIDTTFETPTDPDQIADLTDDLLSCLLENPRIAGPVVHAQHESTSKDRIVGARFSVQASSMEEALQLGIAQFTTEAANAGLQIAPVQYVEIVAEEASIEILKQAGYS